MGNCGIGAPVLEEVAGFSQLGESQCIRLNHPTGALRLTGAFFRRIACKERFRFRDRHVIIIGVNTRREVVDRAGHTKNWEGLP